jgi:hypothetical protein
MLLASLLFLPSLANAQLVEVYKITGMPVTLTADGVSAANPYTLNVPKPANAKLLKAYMVLANHGNNNGAFTSKRATLDGTAPSWVNGTALAFWGAEDFESAYADVTSQVNTKALTAGSTAATLRFTVTETDTAATQGTGIVAFWDDPASSKTAASLYVGMHAPAGETTTINLGSPWTTGKNLELGLGIEWSASSNEYSIVKINGTQLSNTAGGTNDGDSSHFTFGEPSDPYPTGGWNGDAEHYDASSLIADGSTSISLYSQNPSNNDGIFMLWYTSDASVLPTIMQLNSSFSPAKIEPSQTSRLTLTLLNDGQDNSGIQFTDRLPANLILTATPNTSNTCGGAVSADAGASSISLSGGTLSAATTSCTIAVDVTSNASGTYINNAAQISGLSSNLHTSAMTDATLAVDKDTDADSVSDTADLDDDNDGIPDTKEGKFCTTTPTFKSAWDIKVYQGGSGPNCADQLGIASVTEIAAGTMDEFPGQLRRFPCKTIPKDVGLKPDLQPVSVGRTLVRQSFEGISIHGNGLKTDVTHPLKTINNLQSIFGL